MPCHVKHYTGTAGKALNSGPYSIGPWELQSGSSETNSDSGSAVIQRTFSTDASINHFGLLTLIPEGSPDHQFSDLKRARRYTRRIDRGFQFITFDFVGTYEGDPTGQNPYPGIDEETIITKRRTTRSVKLSNLVGTLAPGGSGVLLLPDEPTTAKLTASYTTTENTIEYTVRNEPVIPFKDSNAGLPKTISSSAANAFVHIFDSRPARQLFPNDYYGGLFDKPAGKTEVWKVSEHYELYVSCVEFETQNIVGTDRYQCREVWSVLVKPVFQKP